MINICFDILLDLRRDLDQWHLGLRRVGCLIVNLNCLDSLVIRNSDLGERSVDQIVTEAFLVGKLDLDALRKVLLLLKLVRTLHARSRIQKGLVFIRLDNFFVLLFLLFFILFLKC
jgi:hypothetical protein